MKKQYYVFKINLLKLNVLAIILLIAMFAITYLISPNLTTSCLDIFEDNKMFFFFLPAMLGYMILHELLHALGYILYGAQAKKITFGMDLEKSVLYCLCKQDISRKNILNSSMFPLFYIGIVTYVISIIFEMPLLLLLSIMNISGAAGDIMYFLYFIKLDKNIMFSELDDGTSFAILSENDVTQVKHFGLDFVEKIDEIPRNDFKRVKITPMSWFVVILCLVLTVLGILS